MDKSQPKPEVDIEINLSSLHISARNQAKEKAAAKGSQLKQNKAAESVICKICRQTFLKTIRKPALEVVSPSFSNPRRRISIQSIREKISAPVSPILKQRKCGM